METSPSFPYVSSLLSRIPAGKVTRVLCVEGWNTSFRKKSTSVTETLQLLQFFFFRIRLSSEFTLFPKGSRCDFDVKTPVSLHLAPCYDFAATTKARSCISKWPRAAQTKQSKAASWRLGASGASLSVRQQMWWLISRPCGKWNRVLFETVHHCWASISGEAVTNGLYGVFMERRRQRERRDLSVDEVPPGFKKKLCISSVCQR